MREQYPKHYIIENIGSGLNLNKRGIIKIIHMAIVRKVNELVIAYIDKLTQFGYELIEELITKKEFIYSRNIKFYVTSFTTICVGYVCCGYCIFFSFDVI